MYYNVKPRYTPGSPGMVDQKTAEHVAAQERRCFKEALDGTYGDHLQNVAKTQELLGIVERVYETAIGWEVHDLLTDAQYMRPFTGEGDLSGLYELSCEFENPEPDGRRVRDWRFDSVWGANMRFVITPNDGAISMLHEVNEQIPDDRKLSEEKIREKAGYMITKARDEHRTTKRLKLSDLPMEFLRSLQKVPLLHARDAFDLHENVGDNAEEILCYIVDKLELLDPEHLSDLLRDHYDGVGPFESIPY